MKNYSEILKKNAMLIVLILVYIYFTIRTDGTMFQPLSFNALITQNAYVFILATGMLMCMLTGGNIDLSCGSFVCFVGSIGGVCMVVNKWGTGVSLLVMLGVGLVYGAILGFLIAYVDVPPWIATLAGYLAFRGWGTAILSANSSTGSIAPIPEGFKEVFAGKICASRIGVMNTPCMIVGVIAALITAFLIFRADRRKMTYVTGLKAVSSVAVILLFAYKLSYAGGIPTVLIWVVAIVVIYSFLTTKTTLGRYFYTIGGSKEATRLSGVDTRKIMFFAYLNMAVLTVLTSCIVMSKFQAANSTAGTNYEMDAIAACVVGGVSAYGGSGRVFGMVIGATLIGVINLGMSLVNVDANWQKIVKGCVLLFAVVFDIIASRKQKV